MLRRLAASAALCLLAACADAQTIRIATFNVSLNRDAPSLLARELEGEPSAQARAVVEILREVRPDILIVNELDFDADGRVLQAFQNLLSAANGPGEPLAYDVAFAAPVNTGVASGLDLDRDGTVGGPGDAWGWGDFPGQYGMAVLSRFPIDETTVRTFQRFLWRDLPDNLLPRDFYGGVADQLRLSSKSHWDVPVELGEETTLHLLVSHPTPPVFDGPEDRNGRRNADEVRFWLRYLDDSPTLTDDAGRTGGLPADAAFVVAGDLNLAPVDGDGRAEVIRALLAHARVQDPLPASAGGVEAATEQGRANLQHEGDPALDTADWRDRPGPGNLRVDYLLPSADLRVVDAGVYWPAAASDADGASRAKRASDHRLVWIDVELP